MAYIGRSVDIGMFEKQVLTPNSSTTTFTLTFAVGSSNSLLVVYGGVIQEPGVAYSVSGGGQQIAFSEAPVTGTTLYIIYLGKQLTTPRAAGQETTKQSLTGDGVTTLFTLTDPPVVPAGIMVFVDGILQREGAGNNYVSGGSTINFNGAPDNGAEIDVYTLVKEKVSIDTVADGSITRAKMAATFPYWDAAGNFGIGIASPAFKLQVVGTTQLQINAAGTQQVLQLNNNDTTAGTQAVKLGFSSGGVTKASINGAVYGNDYMTFNVGSDTERMRIDSSGNVGIATSSPAYKLDINTVGGSAATARLYGNDQSNVRLRLENVGAGGRTWELVGGSPGANNANFSIRDVTGSTTPLSIDSTGAVTINGASVATADSKLNTQITSAGAFITLAEFRNLDYTAGTRSFLRVRNAVNAGGSYSSYFGQGQDGRTYIIANNSARGGDIVISGDDGTVLMGTSVTRTGAGLIVNSGAIAGNHKRSANTASFYNSSVGNTRNITISGMGTTGEYYAKVVLVGLCGYSGSGYYTRIVEFCGYGGEGRVSVISNTATGGNTPPTVTVTATATTVNLAVAHPNNYRCVAHLETLAGLDMYISGVDGANVG